MCLVAVALGAHPEFGFVLAANRDELLARPAAPAAPWADAPALLGGRDLEKGGTWLGMRMDDGRLALVTNHRDFRRPKKDLAPSRGELVADYLRGDQSASDFVELVARADEAFEGYNLLAGDVRRLLWHSNVTGETRALEPGRVHGLSNALLDTPWPKVEALTAALRDALAAGPLSLPPDAMDAPGTTPLEDALLRALASSAVAPEARLPDTGVPPELERALSAAFIRIRHGAPSSQGYGTRCSTVITADRQGRVRFVERSFDAPGEPSGTVVRSFTLARGAC